MRSIVSFDMAREHLTSISTRHQGTLRDPVEEPWHPIARIPLFILRIFQFGEVADCITSENYINVRRATGDREGLHGMNRLAVLMRLTPFLEVEYRKG